MREGGRGWRRARLLVGGLAALGLLGCEVPDPEQNQVLAADFVAPDAPVLDKAVAYGPEPGQVADWYLPAPGSSPAPVLVWLHAGGWVQGSRDPLPEVLERQVTRTGWAVVSADYRLTRWDGASWVDTFPAASQDVDRLLRSVRSEASARNLDASRIVVAGGSAGGHLAALAALAPGAFVASDLPAELAGPPVEVAGLMTVSAPLDLEHFVASSASTVDYARVFLGCPAPAECDPDAVVSASPLGRLRADEANDAVPMYLVAGGLDTEVPADPNARALHDLAVPRREGVDDAAGMRSVWLDLVDDDDHFIDQSTMNTRYFEQWLDLVSQHKWPT